MPARKALSGAFSGASDVFGTLLREQMQENISNREAQRNDLLERGRTADQLIASGKLKPEDRDPFIRGSYTGPSVSDKLSTIISGVDKAPTMGQVPSRVALSADFNANDIPTVGVGRSLQPGDESTLPSTQFGPASTPEFSTALGARSAKIRAFPAEKIGEEMAGSGPTLQPQNIFGKWNPDIGGMERTDSLPAGPTAQQKGTAEGLASATTEDLTRSGKVQTDVARANALQPIQVATAGKEAAARGHAETQVAIDRAVQSGGLLPEQASAASDIASRFQADSRPYWTIQQNFRQMAGLTKDQTPAGSIAMTVSYMHMIDPNSIVTAGEQANATNSAGVPEQIRSLYNRLLLNGGRLTPEMQQDFLAHARGIYSAATQEHELRVRDYATQAAMRHIPQELVIRQPAPNLEAVGSTKVVNGRLIQATAVDADGNISATQDMGPAPQPQQPQQPQQQRAPTAAAPPSSFVGQTKVVNGRLLRATAVDAQGNVTATQDIGPAGVR